MSAPVKIGTRGSSLALAQATWVESVLAEAGLSTERTIIQTTGDRVQDRPLPEIGGKGLFTKELDRALLDGEVDLAVHSLKDLPTEPEPGVTVVAIPVREDPRDVLIGPRDRDTSLENLPDGAVVGTSSQRRKALALAMRPDLDIQPIRGNLDTRLRKLDEGQFDALIMAAAGVKRLGLAERVDEWMERTSWLPAPGQGALALVAREDDAATREAVASLRDHESEAAVRAERAVLHVLGGGCSLPLGALGIPYGERLRLWSVVASPDGKQAVVADETGSLSEPEALGRRVAERLLERGAREILSGLEVDPARPMPPP